MQKFKVSGQWILKIVWKQTDGGDCITSHATVVCNISDQIQLVGTKLCIEKIGCVWSHPRTLADIFYGPGTCVPYIF